MDVQLELVQLIFILKALSKLGVKYKINQGYVIANAPKGLKGNKIKFPKISVGATENLIIAASFAKKGKLYYQIVQLNLKLKI